MERPGDLVARQRREREPALHTAGRVYSPHDLLEASEQGATRRRCSEP